MSRGGNLSCDIFLFNAILFKLNGSRFEKINLFIKLVESSCYFEVTNLFIHL